MGSPTFLIPRTATTNSLQRLTAAACVPIFGSTTIILGFEKEHFCQGSIRLQTSRADIVGDTRRASDIWSALVGGDSRAGTGLSVSTNRVTSKMPPAIRTSATRVFVMARSSFIVPKKRERWAGDIKVQQWHSDFWPPVRHVPSSHRDRPRRPGVRLPSSSQSAHMSGDRGCQGEVAVPWRNSQRGNSIGPAPKPPNYWASIKPVAHPFGGVRDDNDPLPNFASAPGDFVACCQSGGQEL